MEDFLNFRKMITPFIIRILFWVGVAGCVIVGLAMMWNSLRGYGSEPALFLVGLLVLVCGPVLVRVYTEILILFFRINETLTEIRHLLASK